MKRRQRKREKSENRPGASEQPRPDTEMVVNCPTVFECPIDYTPGYAYIRQEVIDLIIPQREVLCSFAQRAGVRRAVLGIDFDRYDPARRSVPVYVLDQATIRVIREVEGREFERAYRKSRCGQDVIVIFTMPERRGWFVLGWRLSPGPRMEWPAPAEAPGGGGACGAYPSFGWLAGDGLHFLVPGRPPSPEEMEAMTEAYHERIRSDPGWVEIVQALGEAKAEDLLRGCRIELGSV